MKCGACGDPNPIWSTCKAPDAYVLRWTLAKRKQIAEKYAGQPPPTAHLSDCPTDVVSEGDAAAEDALEYDMQDEYDDTEVGTSFASVAFTSAAALVADLSKYWVVDSACSVNLTSFRSDFSEFHSSARRSTVGGVGVTVQGRGTVRIPICLISGRTVFRHVHALYTLDLSSRSAQRISRLLSVSSMQKHSGCEFSFPTNIDSGMLLVTTGMGMLIPSGNGLYLLPRSHACAGLSSHHVDNRKQKPVALAAECDAALWHSRMGHLNMQSLQAQHSHNTVYVPVMPSSVNDLSCESCNLNKAAFAPKNRKASQKPVAPLQHLSCDLWGPFSVPSPHGLGYCLLVIDHHTNFMWVY
jgi:hypothetical protein